MNTISFTDNNQSKRKTNFIINEKLSSSSSSLHQGAHLTPVYLNLYDLGGCINTCIHSIGLSYYHCAVQIHSAEYGYMGHPYKFTGVYKTSKYDSRFRLYKLRDSIEVGWTWFSEKDIDEIVNDLKLFYIGLDYHIRYKNSINFAKYLLEQLSNDPQSKHFESIKIVKYPSYIDRSRRLTQNFEFLKIFDREKDIAEINILYFLYMKYEGNMREICKSLKCDTIDQLKRCLQLIKQGIQEKKLPLFSAFTQLEIKTAQDYLNILDQSNSNIVTSNNEELTLTDIFHQFDTIALRGRTSIDRYLNIEKTTDSTQKLKLKIEQPSIKMNNTQNSSNISFDNCQGFSTSRMVEIPQAAKKSRQEIVSKVVNKIERSQLIEKPDTQFIDYDRKHMISPYNFWTSLSHYKSQNQDQTPILSSSGSTTFDVRLNIKDQSNYPFTKYTNVIQTNSMSIDQLVELENLYIHRMIPIENTIFLQEKLKTSVPIKKLSSTRHIDSNPFLSIVNQQRKSFYSARKRKLPRDLELTDDLYKIINQNAFCPNYTNNAMSQNSSFSHC